VPALPDVPLEPEVVALPATKRLVPTLAASAVIS
jgi:hypothetical protein